MRHLAHAVQHRDYGLGARLLQGEILFKRESFKDASLEYLEALRLADAITAGPEQADDIRELYEPLVEAQQAQKDVEACRRLCRNVRGLLMRADWRDQIQRGTRPIVEGRRGGATGGGHARGPERRRGRIDEPRAPTGAR